MENELDDIFKKQVEQLHHLPTDIEWNENKGWEAYQQSNHKKQHHLQKKAIFWVAASLLISFLVVFPYIIFNTSKLVLVQNGDKQKLEVKLPDGNTIWLNKNSSVSYSKRVNREITEILISGEVFMEINFLKSKEYKILAENSVIIVNTLAYFNIQAYNFDDNINISVQKGAVRVSETGFEEQLSLLVTSGNYASVHKKYKIVYAAENSSDNYMAWKTGKYVFNETDFETVADILAQYYQKNVEFENENLSYCTFSGIYDYDSLPLMIRRIENTLNCQISDLGDKIYISGDGCFLEKVQ